MCIRDSWLGFVMPYYCQLDLESLFEDPFIL